MANVNTKFYIKVLIPFIVGFIIFLCPVPNGLSLNAWIFVSIFLALIIGLILEPIPPALIGFIGVTVACVFKVGPVGSGASDATTTSAAAINWGLTGFSNAVVWLIFAAFMIGLGFQNSGLGRRIALVLVKKLGKSTLGLGYALNIADLILAPFIPSNAARSGGIIYPIVKSISPMYDSYPEKNSRKIGAYLAWTALAGACVTSSMFLTGQAPNPLALELVNKGGVNTLGWMGWFIAMLPVSIILFILTPILTFILYPPKVKKSPEIAIWAAKELETIGKMKLSEIYMLLIACLALVLWVGSAFFQINATTTAMIVIILMISTKIITWNDFLGNKPAWNILSWFATLVTMASGLKNVGFLDYIAGVTGGMLDLVPPLVAVLLLIIIFSFLRYFFASATAYAVAMVGIFTTLAIHIQTVDVNYNAAQIMTYLILPMGFMGILTPYGTGHSPVWFGSGYIKGPDFWKLGAIFGIIYLGIFIIVGIPWIKMIFGMII